MNLSARIFRGKKTPQRFRRSFRHSAVSLCALLLLLAVLGSGVASATTFTVTDNTDNAADTGSLRYAVNTAVDGDTIQFLNVIGTITLTPANGPLTIAHSIAINGPGAGLLTISGNNAVEVFAVNSGTVTISGLTIANGNAGASGYGGAIDNAGTLTLTACIFSNDTSPTNNGGAIYSIGSLTVADSTFSDNTTGSAGGAIASGTGTLTVQNSTFSGNTSGAGGAIFGQSTSIIENSTFFGNNPTTGPGGGIFNGGTMTVSNSTIAGNAVDGIWNNGSSLLTISNSIVAGNTGGSDCDNCGTQGANNLIGGTPNLGPLQFNGWITKTMMPLPGSPAIGMGLGSTLATDQRGFARPIGSGVASDVGAVQTNYLTVTNLTDSTDAGTCTRGAVCSLRDAISLANSTGTADIVFQSGLTGTITLASALPSIVTSHVNIEGPGAKTLTLSGAPPPANFEAFDVSGSSAVVNLRGLTVANGTATNSAAGLSNSGFLTVEDSAFSRNTGNEGGAVFNNGTAVLQGCTFSNNSATDGGGILNQSTLVAINSTFNGNRAYNGNGGGVGNPGGTALLYNSTFSGNEVLNGGIGGGIFSSGPLMLANNVVSGNTNLQTNTPDDCSGCGTPSVANLIGGTANLGPLAYNGLNASLQTMIPLPNSPVIQAGDPTQLPPDTAIDERGFPRLTAGKLDFGAVQTNYTAVQFVQQPTTTVVNANIAPAVTAEVLEANGNLTAPNNTDPVDGIPLTLTFSGTGTLAGTLTQTTAGSTASFADLNVNSTGIGDTLATSLAVTGGSTLTATSAAFDIVLPTPTVSFNPALPASVTYGVAPLTLKATTVNSAGQPTGQTVTFQVNSGPGTVSGNVLTITGVGTVTVEVDAAANGTYGAAKTSSPIVVNPASLTVTAANAARAYGAANPVFTGTYVGAVYGDTFTVSGATTATASSPIGSYPIAPTATGTNLADYTVTYVNGTLTVGQAGLTATATNASRVYGTANPTFTGSLTGALNGDTFSETFSTSATTASSAGTYAIVPAVKGANLANYTLTTVPGTLTVAKAASKLSLTASATQITPGTSVTLTATASSTTTGTPTDTVTFQSGSTTLGTAPLNAQGVATLAVTTLPVGSNTVTANYAGDTNFTGSQAQLNTPIVVGTPSYTMTANPTGLTVRRGQSGVATVTLTPTYGYTGTVQFSCSGLPIGSTCHFQPASVTFTGTTPVQVKLAISIGTSSLVRNTQATAWLRPLKPLQGLPVLPAMFFWLPGTRWARDDEEESVPAQRRPKAKSHRMLWLVALLAFSIGLVGLVGCAGLSPNYPPGGNYTVNVIGLGSGGVNQSVAIQVNVQP